MEHDKETASLGIRVGNTTEPDKVTIFLPRRNNHTDFAGSNDSRKLLIETDTRNNNPEPPIAGSEIDDLDDDDREVANAPYPGVDDGFFSNDEPPRDPNVENIPTLVPRTAYYVDAPDEPDGPRKPELPPFPPGPGFDVESGPDGGTIPDINIYQHRKTLAQGMMDLALLSANANQLRYVLESYDRHPYYYPSLVMVSFSLILQIAVGVGLIWNARYNVKDERQMCIANRINNFTIIGIFLVTVINVFISAFGVANVSALIVP